MCIHPKRPLRFSFWAVPGRLWYVGRVGWKLIMYMLILHYAVIQLRYSRDQAGPAGPGGQSPERARDPTLRGPGSGRRRLTLSRASSAHALVAFKFQPKPTGRRSACRFFFSGNRSQTFTVFLPAEYVTTRKLAVPALTSRTASSRAPLSLPPDSSARQTGYAGREVRKNREAHEARTSLRPADRAVWRR